MLLFLLRLLHEPLLRQPQRQFRLRLPSCQLHLSNRLRHLRARQPLYRRLLPNRWPRLRLRRNRQQLYRFVPRHRLDSPQLLLEHHDL